VLNIDTAPTIKIVRRPNGAVGFVIKGKRSAAVPVWRADG